MSPTAPTSRRRGPAVFGLGLTLTSALFMSALGVTTQLAFDAGVSVGTVLSGRFLVAMVVVWVLVWILRSRRPTERQVVAGFLLGVGYSAHAWLFSASLARLDAGLVDLLLFTYPALVLLGAVGLGRDRWSTRRGVALGTATAGTALVLIGGLHSIDPLGAVLALGAAVAYAAYVLTSARELERTDPLVLIALVTTGAAITLTLGGLARSDVSFDAGAPALALVVAVGLLAVTGMATFVAGIARLGPARASIVSAVQPAVTPVLGFAIFADRLGPAQMLGGGLVVAGVVILETRGRDAQRSWLSWLPKRERRALAGAAVAVDVPAGRLLVQQGAPAGAFFLIERGSATVVRDGRPVAHLGPGEFFGEIALLRGGNRTASILAATEMRVRVLHEREFARAMDTLPALARSVGRVMTGRTLALPTKPAIA